MIRIRLGDQLVAIPGELLSQAITDALPGFLSGKEKAEGQAGLIKSGIKAVIPLCLGLAHKSIAKNNLPIAPPDLKCSDARENIILYAIGYLFKNFLALSDQFIIETETYQEGNEIVISAFSTLTTTEEETAVITA